MPNYTKPHENETKPSSFIAQPDYHYSTDDWNSWHDQAIWFRDAASGKLRADQSGDSRPNGQFVSKKWGDENGGGNNRWDYWHDIAWNTKNSEDFYR